MNSVKQYPPKASPKDSRLAEEFWISLMADCESLSAPVKPLSEMGESFKRALACSLKHHVNRALWLRQLQTPV